MLDRVITALECIVFFASPSKLLFNVDKPNFYAQIFTHDNNEGIRS